MQGNPCAKIKGYRQFLVDNMPQLRSLDEFIVMDFERKDIAKLYPPEALKTTKLQELNRFRPFNPETTSWRATPFVIQSTAKSSEEMKSEKIGRFALKRLEDRRSKSSPSSDNADDGGDQGGQNEPESNSHKQKGQKSPPQGEVNIKHNFNLTNDK